MERFCTNCGQKVPDNSEFCTNCGAKVAPQQQQQFQQAPQQNFGQQPQQGFYNQNQNSQNNQNNIDPQAKSKNSLALALSIASLCLGIIGSLLFGIFLSLPSLAAGIFGVITAIDVKKRTNNALGQGAFVIGIIAIVFSAIFTIGCSTCSSGYGGYACYGCVGGTCKASNDISNVYDDYYDLFN